MSDDAPVLRFGGASGDETPFGEGGGLASSLFQGFATWLGAVYAMEHDMALDPESLAVFDPSDVIPLYRQDAERARNAMDQGLTIEQTWLVEQLLLRRPSTCVVVDRFAGQPLDRITRVRVTTADALADELIDRLARNFRFEGRTPWVAGLEDAYFESAPPIAVGVVLGQGGHTVSLVSANPLTRDLLYHDPWPTGTLVPGGQPSGQERQWRIGAGDLVSVLVFAMIEDTPAVERSPDIYAPTVRREADPSKGAPLDVAWHANWELGGPSYCLVSQGCAVGSIERIPYRAELPAAKIVSTLVQAWRQRPQFVCVAHVRIGPESAHSVTLQSVDEAQVLFHDPWPEGSLLAAGRNEMGIDAQSVEHGSRMTTAELERCLLAVFVSPEVLAEIQGQEHRRKLGDVLAALSFFSIHETGRTRLDDVWEVEAQPGGFQDNVRIRFAVDDGDWLQSALLSIERAWLDSPNRPFGIDILKSFISATVSPLDLGEAGLAVRAIEAITFGRDAVIEALGAGAPHLMGQARALVAALLGAQESALGTYAFTRLVAVNRAQGNGWLHVGVERAGRTAGPFLVGTELPSPWKEQAPA